MFHIRKARIEDAEDIAFVHLKSWKSVYAELIDEQDVSNITMENRLALWESILRMRNEGHVALVLHDDDGRIIGFISGGKERTKRFGYDGEIYAVYLLDEYQRQGLGTRLLEAFCKEMYAVGHRSLLVWVLTDNPSRAFYINLDAKQIEEEDTTIGTGTYRESAYGWTDLNELIENLSKKTMPDN